MKFAARFSYKDGLLHVEVPYGLRDGVARVDERARLRHGGFGSFSVDTPRRPRSTGEKSQSHHINGHCQQIAESTGASFDAVKMHMKRLAIDRGWRFDTLPDGSVAPKSEADASVEEATALIDVIHQFADEWNIRLKEGEEE